MELIIGVVCVSECFEDIFHRVIDEVVAEKSKWMLGPHKEANLQNQIRSYRKDRELQRKATCRYTTMYTSTYTYIRIY